MGAYKDKNGTWYAQFRFTNWKGEPDRKTKRGFATKREALDWERDFLTRSSGNLEMTFEAFYELYKKNMKERIKLSTWNMKESVIEGKILPYFKRKRMCDIKPRDVVEWQNTLIKTGNENGEPYSPVYLKTIHNQLSAIFNHAVKFYDLPSNPARKAGNMGKEKSREMLFWTQSEYKAFSEAIMDKPISFYAFEVLYWGGLRLGEMLALTKKDIDFKRGIIRITKSFQRIKGEDLITDPKTPNSVRNVQMPDFLAEELKDYIGSLYGVDDSDRIFPITKSYLHHEMKRGCEASGVKKIRIHDLRHPYVKHTTKKYISAIAEIPNYQLCFDSLGFLFLCIEAVWMFIVCQCVLCQTFLNILPHGLIFVNLRDIYSLFRAYMLFDYFPPCQEMFWLYRISAYRL